MSEIIGAIVNELGNLKVLTLIALRNLIWADD